jgi:hypothetical protein
MIASMVALLPTLIAAGPLKHWVSDFAKVATTVIPSWCRSCCWRRQPYTLA